MLKLMNSADMAKHTLSTLSSANCFVDSLHDGMDFECNVSRWAEAICSQIGIATKIVPVSYLHVIYASVLEPVLNWYAPASLVRVFSQLKVSSIK